MNQLKYASVASGLLQALLFLAVFLPAGSVFGLPNIKVLVLVLFLIVLAFCTFANDKGPSLGDVVFLFLVSSCLVLWSLIGALNGQGSATEILSQLKDIGSTILLAWLSRFGIKKGIVRAEAVIRAVVYGCLALSVVKLAIIAGVFAYGVDMIGMVERAFGESSFITVSIAPGLFRMEFASDILQPFALFAVLVPNVSGVRFGRAWTLIITLVFLISGFLAFGRYIWAVYVVAFLAAMVLRRNWKGLAVTVVAALTLYGAFRESLDAAFLLRFQSEGTERSDYERVEQTRALINEVERRPLFGKGMGSHTNAVVRLETHSYAYEVQWLAFLMQFGVVGLTAILLLIWGALRDLIAARRSGKLWLCLLFLLWLVSSFTNPHLTSSFAGAAFALFLAMFYKARYPNDKRMVHCERHASV